MSNPTASTHLIEPSSYRPWSVEVVTAVPSAVMRMNDDEEPKKKRKKTNTALDSSQVNTGAVCTGWACLGSPKGSLYVWPTNSTSSGRILVSPSATKRSVIDPPKSCVTLFHPSLAVTNKKPVLIALTPASPDAVCVYAAQPELGLLVVWKVTQDDVHKVLTNPRTISYAQTTLTLEKYDEGEDEDHSEDECLTSLNVLNRHLVVVGTSNGSLFCCTQTAIPVSLHATRMVASRSSRKSIIGLFWGGSSGDDNDTTPSLFQLPLSAEQDDNQEFLSISQDGNIKNWKILPTIAATHQVKAEVFRVVSLKSLFQENHPQSSTLVQVTPLQAKRLGTRLHILVRTTYEDDDETSDSRLYWVRLRLGTSTDSKAETQWVDAQWLNRFPAPQDVTVMGLVLCENDMAYAAFHQRSGGLMSAVLVMALSGAPEGWASETATIYEVDLPMTEIPALLPHTFTNDVVTHGCCVLARSGLGIRIRVHPSANCAPLSPRAAARTNPAAVLKLTTHLRSAFSQHYQHQDASSRGSLSLPPSLLEASPVDIEEAVIAVATQLHHQGDNWYASSITSNGLEHHLAFVHWLRQGGLYRSLTKYGKWRLLGLGQEVAAFLELVAPSVSSTSSEWEQEQFVQLKLSSGVAVWLKQQLAKVLKEQNPHHYSLWCGWFSTAMSTAMAYREERGNDPYDISHNETPPMVGSNSDDSQSTKVPVWTSHPVLQDVFGTLLQHWKTKRNVQVLPPKTVEVIVKAALESFADSAASLNTERAVGMYAEVKALSIPLIRMLHPPLQAMAAPQQASKDDVLAFQLSVKHDYYEGICEIAHDHEIKGDKVNFRLEPLLQSSTHCQSIDFQSGRTFGQFVLQWHADRGLFGHAILFGRQCPEQDLSYLLQNEDRLRPYQWIQAVHSGDFNSAASSLIERAENPHQVTVSETKWALCMAKMANQVVLKESQNYQIEAQLRDRKIENRLELVGVQKQLLADGESYSEQHLWSANRLLSLALDKADQASFSNSATSQKDAVHFCYLGLLVCLTYNDYATQLRNAAQVWAKAVAVDWKALWEDWIRTADDLSNTVLAETILDNTVFGGLLKECSEDREGFSSVIFSNETMEHNILEQLGLVQSQGGEALPRLLYTVANTFQQNVAQEEADIEPMEE